MPTERRVGKGKNTNKRAAKCKDEGSDNANTRGEPSILYPFPRCGMDFGRCIIWEPVRSMVMMDSQLGTSQRSRNELLQFGSLSSTCTWAFGAEVAELFVPAL